MGMGPTRARLMELLRYDPETGAFTHRVNISNRKAGDVAGCVHESRGNYCFISIDDKIYRAHKLAWLYVTGEWPDRLIDHRNLNRADNAFCNLRMATKSQNQANMKAPSHNTSGIKGVSPYRVGERYGKPWQATIRKDGKSIHLGHFSTKEHAAAAYAVAADRIFGEFARAN